MNYLLTFLVLFSLILSGCGSRKSSTSVQAAAAVPSVSSGVWFTFPPENSQPEDGWIAATAKLGLANPTAQAIEPFYFRITAATILTAEGKSYDAVPMAWLNLSVPVLNKRMQFSFLPIHPGTYQTLYQRSDRGEYVGNFHFVYRYAEAAHPTHLQLEITRTGLGNNNSDVNETITIPLGQKPQLPAFPPDNQAYSITDFAADMSKETQQYRLSFTSICTAESNGLSVSLKNKDEFDSLDAETIDIYLSYQKAGPDGSVFETIYQRAVFAGLVGPGQTYEGQVEVPQYSEHITHVIAQGRVYSLACE